MGLFLPRRLLFHFITTLILLECFTAQKEPSCGRAKNCNECMGIRPACSWCSADEYDDTKEGPGFRCAPSSVLLSRGCPKDSIENVESTVLGELNFISITKTSQVSSLLVDREISIHIFSFLS
ncbi:unnamed protein product [Trichobilharzia regenti]|nr:unnamed protein product [Trichobilharzia regenti]